MSNVVAAPPTGGGTYSEKEINDGKAMSAVGYVPICGLPLFLLPMFAAKENKYAQYHARQAMVLYLAGLGAFIVSFVLNFVLAIIHVPCVGAVIGAAIGIGFLVLMVIGIVNAFQGQAKELPVLGGFAGKVPV